MPVLEYGEWIDTIGLFLTVSGILLGFVYTQVLQNEGDRQDLIAALHAGKVRNLYQGGVAWLLRGLQKLYGKADSFQAFGVSLLLAYLYPILFFVLTYSYLDGTHLFSGTALLPADSPYREYFFPGLLLINFIAFITVKIFAQNNHWGRIRLLRIGLSPIVADRGSNLARHLITAVAAMFVAAIGDFIITGITVAVFFVAAKNFISSIAVLLTMFAVSLFTGIFVINSMWKSDYKVSLIFAFFYLMLPLVNALLDWLSWWVSRFFLEQTAQPGAKVTVIVRDIALDFTVAMLFMLALSLLLPAGAIALDSLYAGWMDVNTGVPAQTGWQDYALWARDDPWGKGLMVTLMLVTTLIPTLLHIVMGLMAFFIHSFKGAALATFLEQPRKNWRDAAACLWVYGYFIAALLTLWALWQLFQQIVHLPIALWLYHFTGYFYDLP